MAWNYDDPDKKDTLSMAAREMRYKVRTCVWDDKNYLAIWDNREGRYICFEPLDFHFYPEGAFVEPRNEAARADLERIVGLLNSTDLEG